MTAKERVAASDARKRERGLVRLPLWVAANDADFFRALAQLSRGDEPEEPGHDKPPVVRHGRASSPEQLTLARQWATRSGLKLPDYAETHHLSLMGWIDYARRIVRQRDGGVDIDDMSTAYDFVPASLDEVE